MIHSDGLVVKAKCTGTRVGKLLRVPNKVKSYAFAMARKCTCSFLYHLILAYTIDFSSCSLTHSQHEGCIHRANDPDVCLRASEVLGELHRVHRKEREMGCKYQINVERCHDNHPAVTAIGRFRGKHGGCCLAAKIPSSSHPCLDGGHVRLPIYSED